MYKTSLRAQRVAADINRHIVKLFSHKITDARLKDVVITLVDVSPDLRNAKVFFTLKGDTKLSSEIVDALSKASHFLRKKIAALVALRVVPKLNFEYDHVYDRANRIEELLQQTVVGADQSSPAPDVSEHADKL